MHDSVYEVAGDPRMAKALRSILEGLAGGPDGPLRELAEGVLAGAVDLREVAGTEYYGAALSASVEPMMRRLDELDEDARRDLLRRAEAELDALHGPA